MLKTGNCLCCRWLQKSKYTSHNLLSRVTSKVRIWFNVRCSQSSWSSRGDIIDIFVSFINRQHSTPPSPLQSPHSHARHLTFSTATQRERRISAQWAQVWLNSRCVIDCFSLFAHSLPHQPKAANINISPSRSCYGIDIIDWLSKSMLERSYRPEILHQCQLPLPTTPPPTQSGFSSLFVRSHFWNASCEKLDPATSTPHARNVWDQKTPWFLRQCMPDRHSVSHMTTSQQISSINRYRIGEFCRHISFDETLLEIVQLYLPYGEI